MMSDDASGREGSMYALFMLISGTFSTVIMKSEYSVRAPGIEQCIDQEATRLVQLASNGTSDQVVLTNVCPFDKPWFGVLQMKIAMALCLVFLYLRKITQHKSYLETPVIRLQKDGRKYMATPERRQLGRGLRENTSLLDRVRGVGSSGGGGTAGVSRGDYTPIRNHEDEDSLAAQQTKVTWQTMAAIALPSMFDLFQTVFGNVGLLWISSSVYQMARGSVIIFSAFFSVKCMKKQLFAYHYMSIFIVAVSVCLVGWAGVDHSNSTSTASQVSASRQILGLFFIIFAQVLCAGQIVVEEHMMVSMNVSPMLLVGLEGLWGLVFYIVLIPILSMTPPGTTALSKIWHEDFYDSVVKIWHSVPLLLLILAYIVAVGTLNVTANYVTKHLSAVIRSIVETLRTLGVWLLGLFVFYVVHWRGANSPGEQWTTYSWLELFGFVLMVYGTLAYKKLIRYPIDYLYAGEEALPARVYKSPFMSSMHK